MDARVDVVVVTTDTPDVTERCVAALDDSLLARRIVVDNGPQRTAGARVRERFGAAALVVEPGAPTGFAAACNLGAAVGDAPLVLFLNSDVIARRGAIARLVAALETTPGAVAAGGRLVDPGPCGATQPAYEPKPLPGAATLAARATGLDTLLPGRRTSTAPAFDETAPARPVAQPAGACFLVRRTDLDAVAGFDERFWFWYEDVDLAKRLAARGTLLHVAGAVFEHLGGESFGDWSHARGVRSLLHGVTQYAGVHLGRAGRAALGLAIVVASTPRAALLAVLPGRRELARAHRDAVRAGLALLAGRDVPALAP